MVPNLQAHPVALCVSIALISVYAIQTVKSYAKGKLPPGPKGIPFLGSIFQLSKTPWKEFEVWNKQYGMSTNPPWFCEADMCFNPGPLMYLTLGGQGILVINTHRVAADLLDRRGHIYSDRPRMISKCRRYPQPLPSAEIAVSGGRDPLWWNFDDCDEVQ